jgi:hypothetical protein
MRPCEIAGAACRAGQPGRPHRELRSDVEADVFESLLPGPLLAPIYEVPAALPRLRAEMRILAFITAAESVPHFDFDQSRGA